MNLALLSLRLRRFAKPSNIIITVSSAIGGKLLDIAIDAILSAMGVIMPINLAWYIIGASLILSIWWVLQRRDNETTAKQINETIHDIDVREKDIVIEMLPLVIAENMRKSEDRIHHIFLAPRYKDKLKELGISGKDVDGVSERMAESQVSLLFAGETPIVDAKARDKQLDSLRKKINVLQSDLMNSSLDKNISKRFEVRQHTENARVALKVMKNCLPGDVDYSLIKKVEDIIASNNNLERTLNEQVTTALAQYTNKAVKKFNIREGEL